MLYSSIGILALAIHFIINRDVLWRFDPRQATPALRSYRTFLRAITVYYGSDVLWGLLYERRLVTLTFIDTSLYFLAMAVSVLLWTRYVIVYLREETRFGKLLTWMGWLIFLFQITAVIVNFFHPVLFMFDSEGTYHAESARYAGIFLQIVMFITTGAYALAVDDKSTRTMKMRHRAIGFFSLAMSGFVICQSLNPLLPLYAVGCMLGTCLLHSFVLETEKDEYRNDLEERLKENLEKGNYYDLLTGLPGMTYFFELAQAARKAFGAQGKQPVFLYMNLSGVKFYNLSHGFASGDRLLQRFAMLLISAFGSDNCSRFGEDHFVVFTSEEGLEDKLSALFGDWSAANGKDCPPIRVGIYPDRIEGVEISAACDRAKAACDAMRNNYISAWQYYDTQMLANAEKQRYIISHLDQAIAERWIQVYYQPIVRATSGFVCDEECLARWIDPERGFLSPIDFIPILEEANLIYKLDLYVVDRVLEKLDYIKENKLFLVPHSINLSRSDFDACDIVEEIRRRVDDAGFPRELLTIEITESIIGSDFEFMNAQVERFRSLGFPVWMDDFGSGYSSLDLLQSIRVDLIKFDMSFVRKLDNGDNSKIILTELMKMALALGVDTVCEGVETESQARFLQEIGCSKLQGYYFGKPLPFEQILERYRTGLRIGFENAAESDYYEALGRINLYDLAVISNEDEDAFQNFFNTVPMAILEIRDDQIRYLRSNQSYREFMKRFFAFDLSKDPDAFTSITKSHGPMLVKTMKQCRESKGRALFDEKMQDGSVVHAFARYISANAVTDSVAMAIAVLSVSDPDEGATYADIARALAADYYNIYVVDLETEHYIEYSSQAGEEDLAVERHGEDFFESSKRDAYRIYAEDRPAFYAAFSKQNVVDALDHQGAFTATYRLMDTGEPVHVAMKVTRMQPGSSRIIIGISIVDALMKQKP